MACAVVAPTVQVGHPIGGGAERLLVLRRPFVNQRLHAHDYSEPVDVDGEAAGVFQQDPPMPATGGWTLRITWPRGTVPMMDRKEAIDAWRSSRRRRNIAFGGIASLETWH